jgi:hypothetical protein
MTSTALLPEVAPREHLGAGRVKGSLLRAHVDWVRDHRSREETIEFFEALPAALRHELSSLLPTTWHSFSTLIAIDRAIVDRFGHGRIDLLEELGTWSARTTLSGVYRFFRRDDIHDFFARAALLHVQYQDFGTAAYDATSETSGRMIHRGYASYSPLYCASAIGFYRECIRLHGGSRITIAEVSCHCLGDGNCTFELAWQ